MAKIINLDKDFNEMLKEINDKAWEDQKQNREKANAPDGAIDAQVEELKKQLDDLDV